MASKESDPSNSVFTIILGMAALVAGLICLANVLESSARDIDCKAAKDAAACIAERAASRSGLMLATEILVVVGVVIALTGVATMRSKPAH